MMMMMIFIFIVSNVAISWVARLLRDWQVLGSDIGLESGLPHAPFFSGVFQFHRTKAGP
jgi:hypothetical protein